MKVVAGIIVLDKQELVQDLKVTPYESISTANVSLSPESCEMVIYNGWYRIIAKC